MPNKYFSAVENILLNVSFRLLTAFFLASAAIMMIFFLIVFVLIIFLPKAYLDLPVSTAFVCAPFLFLVLSCFLSYLLLKPSAQIKEKNLGEGSAVNRCWSRKLIFAFLSSLFLIILVLLSWSLSGITSEGLKLAAGEEPAAAQGNEADNGFADANNQEKVSMDDNILQNNLQRLNTENPQNYYIEKGAADRHGDVYYLYEGNEEQKRQATDIALPITDISKVASFWYDEDEGVIILSRLVQGSGDRWSWDEYYYASVKGYRLSEDGKSWDDDFDLAYNINMYFKNSLVGYCPEANRLIFSKEYADGGAGGGTIFYKDIEFDREGTKIKKEGEIKEFGGSTFGSESFLMYIGFADGLAFFERYDPETEKITNVISINVLSMEEKIAVDFEKALPDLKIDRVDIIKGKNALSVGSGFVDEYVFDIATKTLENVSKNDVRSWKTYFNDRVGYSVKAPSNWIVEQDAESGKVESGTDMILIPEAAEDYGIYADEIKISYPMELKGDLEGLTKEEKPSDVSSREFFYIKINGVNALVKRDVEALPEELDGEWFGRVDKKVSLPMNDGKVLEISGHWTNAGFEDFFDKIASSLELSGQ